MEALMNTHYAMDGIIKKNDMDGDGDNPKGFFCIINTLLLNVTYTSFALPNSSSTFVLKPA
jgi:hypothetical protein